MRMRTINLFIYVMLICFIRKQNQHLIVLFSKHESENISHYATRIDNFVLVNSKPTTHLSFDEMVVFYAIIGSSNNTKHIENKIHRIKIDRLSTEK